MSLSLFMLHAFKISVQLINWFYLQFTMWTDQNKTAQNRTEQKRTEQNRTEQNISKQNKTLHSKLVFILLLPKKFKFLFILFLKKNRFRLCTFLKLSHRSSYSFLSFILSCKNCLYNLSKDFRVCWYFSYCFLYSLNFFITNLCSILLHNDIAQATTDNLTTVLINTSNR